MGPMTARKDYSEINLLSDEKKSFMLSHMYI